MSNKNPNSGRWYEKTVADIYRQFAGVAKVTENEHIVGKSGRSRQIDVTLRMEIAGNPLLVLVECKDYKQAVGIEKVEELIGKMDDVAAHLGVLVSNSGFRSGAVERAKTSGRIRLVTVVDAENTLLRARIKLGVSVTFFEMEQKGFSLTADFTQTAKLTLDEMTTIFAKEQGAIESSFFAWYKENATEIEAGDHEYRQTITTESGQMLTAVSSFRQSVRTFFNADVWDKGVGIYDAVEQKIIEGDVFKSVFLDFPHIKENWRDITGEEIEERIGVEYRVIYLYEAAPPFTEGQIKAFLNK